ncbi:MAG: T9SS type A sorting domain-containing protein [Bacteroidetes bacterium]|nr:T9SS type A sorting domain-containing protein [Bacteroidota bacterium]
MIRGLFALAFFSLISLPAFSQISPIGKWQEHLEFGPAKKIVFLNDHMMVASKWGIFSVTYEDRIIERYSKINGLNDIGVQTIQYDPLSEKLLIAYNNSNLDVMTGNRIINIPYILRSNVSGDKTINDILMQNNKAYLSTGIGIIVVNLDKYEISATWPMGKNGNAIRVYACNTDENYFYAATTEGLKRLPLSNKNPENFANWELISNGSQLPAGQVTNILNVKGQLYAQHNDRLYKSEGLEWKHQLFDGWQWEQLNVSNEKILITQYRNNRKERRIVIWDTRNDTIENTIENNQYLEQPRSAYLYDGACYIADAVTGIQIVRDNSFESIKVNSPYGTLDGEMIFQNNKLYVAGGSVNSAWNYLYNETGFFVYDKKEWTAYNYKTQLWSDTVKDIITLAVDPADETIYAGSFGSGLNNNTKPGGGLMVLNSPKDYVLYNQGSAVGKTIGDEFSYRIGGLALDQERNLWFSNFGAEKNFGVKTADNRWFKFKVPFIIQDNMVGGILLDDFNQKWIQVPQGNGIYCYNHGNSIENTGDDQWKWLRTGKGNGNLPGNLVQAMAKDKDGFIWLGTDKGIGIIQCPGEVFTANGCEAYQPVVQQDNFAGLLFANEEVRAIAVDGANRKWIGTNNGVWLISADGEKIISRFTEENSPLLSNVINRIAIDPQSGEVYFSTFKGICSYRGTATEGPAQQEQVLVFPNPVPSGYGGQIGIRGLAANSFVKITELNGRLVYQTRAFGGQAVWNGKDYNGNRISTGVYLILVTDETGIEKTAGKIIIVK